MGLDHEPAADSQGRIGRSFVTLLTGEVVNKAARFAATVALARTLELDEFGIVNVGIAIAGITLVATSLGLPDLATRDVAVAHPRLAQIARVVISARVAAVVLLGGTLVGLLALAGVLPVDVAIVAWLMSLSFALSADWALRGLERMPAVAISAAVGGIVVLLGALVVVPLAPTATVALAAFAVGEAAAAAYTWRSARITRSMRPTLEGARPMLRRSWPLAVSALVVYLYYANLDIVLLSILRTNEEAGLYSAPYRVFLAFNAIATFAAYATLPAVARAVTGGDPARARGLLVRVLPALAGLGIVMLGLVELSGGPLLRTLFGLPFGAMEDEFVVLFLSLPWYCVGFPLGYAFIGFDRNKAFLTGAGVACGANVALNLALIPSEGPMGAAIATAGALVAATVTWLALHGLLRRTLPVLTLLAAVTAGAVITATTQEVRFVVGIVTLLAGLVACSRIGATDLVVPADKDGRHGRSRPDGTDHSNKT